MNTIPKLYKQDTCCSVSVTDWTTITVIFPYAGVKRTSHHYTNILICTALTTAQNKCDKYLTLHEQINEGKK